MGEMGEGGQLVCVGGMAQVCLHGGEDDVGQMEVGMAGTVSATKEN